MSRRYSSLDGLRGLAAISVFVWHVLDILVHDSVSGGPGVPLVLRTAPIGWVCNGNFAVLVFFALSGFVLAQLMGRARWPGGLVAQRLFRLLPVATIGTVAGFAVMRLGLVRGVTPYPEALHATCAELGSQIVVTVWRGGNADQFFDRALWSIGVEFRCSLLLLAFVALFREVQSIGSRLILHAWLIYVGYLSTGPFWPMFELGWLASDLHNRYALAFDGSLTWWVVLVAALLMASSGPAPKVDWFVIWHGRDPGLVAWLVPRYVAAAALVPCVLYLRILRNALSSTVCRFLGRVSYPLYAIHQPLLYASLHPLARILGAPLAAVTVFIPCCAVAYIIAQFVDEPLNAITKHHVTATIAPEGAAIVPSSMPIS